MLSPWLRGLLNSYSCTPFSAMHAAVVVGVLGGTAAAVAVGRVARTRGPQSARRVDHAWAALLATGWLANLGFGIATFQPSDGLPVPLHVCDVVGLIAPVAVVRRWRTLRAIVYFWGIGLSTQAFITPVMSAGPRYLAFWVYFGCHAAIVGGAGYDLFARRFRPSWRDWQRAAAAALVYAVVMFAIDAATGCNFGYLGPATNRRTLLAAFGPWPARVPWLVLTAVGVMAALALPWRQNRRRAIERFAPRPTVVVPPAVWVEPASPTRMRIVVAAPMDYPIRPAA